MYSFVINNGIFRYAARKFFPITFLGSILWIAAYSYLMVWWATVVGDTVRIPPEVSTVSATSWVIITTCNTLNSTYALFFRRGI
jgi:hypothetical protein